MGQQLDHEQENKRKGKITVLCGFPFSFGKFWGKDRGRKERKITVFCKMQAEEAIVNLVQKRKIKISTIDESEKFDEKSLQ